MWMGSNLLVLEDITLLEEQDDFFLRSWVLIFRGVYVSNLILCFIRFWMNLDKFVMVKVASHVVNGD